MVELSIGREGTAETDMGRRRRGVRGRELDWRFRGILSGRSRAGDERRWRGGGMTEG